MTVRASRAFVSYAGGVRRLFKCNDEIPPSIAAQVAAHTYDDGIEALKAAKPRKRTTKKSD